MYNGANGDTFCEVLVSRRRGTPETVKAALAIIVGLLFSAVIILLRSRASNQPSGLLLSARFPACRNV